MATKKKPKVYTNTGRVKKPVARKAEPSKNLTAEYAQAMADQKYAKISAPAKMAMDDLRVIVDPEPQIDYKGMFDSAVEINKNLASTKDDIDSRTIKLWFGWSLVRPDKK